MNKFVILSLITLISCGDMEVTTRFSTEDQSGLTELTEGFGNCGNFIREYDEECDMNSPGYCENCRFPRMIFVNNSLMTAPDLGIQDLNEKCTEDAIIADIYGTYGGKKTWKAWISKDGMSIKDHIYNSPGLYISRTGDIIAYSFTDLTDGSINIPIIHDQNGMEHLDQDVWTGTLSDGSFSFNNCNNWISNSGEFGTVGKTNTITADWTNTQDLGDCSSRKLIYCIEDEYLE